MMLKREEFFKTNRGAKLLSMIERKYTTYDEDLIFCSCSKTDEELMQEAYAIYTHHCTAQGIDRLGHRCEFCNIKK